MSREIKFRAWYEKDKQMIDWFSITRNAWNTFRGEQPLSLIYEILVARKDDFNVMQYTGLKDKNGVEIYEGDIVRILYTDWSSKSYSDPRTLEQYLIDIANIGEIEFYYDSWEVKFKSKLHDGDIWRDSIRCGKHGYIEVIGNIYEHSHLLK